MIPKSRWNGISLYVDSLFKGRPLIVVNYRQRMYTYWESMVSTFDAKVSAERSEHLNRTRASVSRLQVKDTSLYF